MKPHKKPQGFSLVELMISLSLGLFISLAVIQIYLATLKSDKVIMGNTEIQENARFALQVLEKTLQQAGYFSNLKESRQEFFRNQANQWANTVFTSSNAIQGFDATETPVANQPASASGTDQVFIRFVSDAAVLGIGAQWYDCNGAVIPANTAIQMGFYIHASSGSLNCVSEIPGVKVDPQPLISNVSDFQLLYGIDSTNDGAVNRYINAPDVGTGNHWDHVRAIKVSLTLASSIPGLNPKLYEKTISLRNML
ncbi:MAG: PilW family protein [Pseudomonadales bacterium]|nr:PilW family protein [Pseudomonadales bacterium]